MRQERDKAAVALFQQIAVIVLEKEIAVYAGALETRTRDTEPIREWVNPDKVHESAKSCKF